MAGQLVRSDHHVHGEVALNRRLVAVHGGLIDPQRRRLLDCVISDSDAVPAVFDPVIWQPLWHLLATQLVRLSGVGTLRVSELLGRVGLLDFRHDVCGGALAAKRSGRHLCQILKISVESGHVHGLWAHVVIDLTPLRVIGCAPRHGTHPLRADAEVLDVLRAAVLIFAHKVDFGVYLACYVHYRVNALLHIQIVVLILPSLHAERLLVVLWHQIRIPLPG